MSVGYLAIIVLRNKPSDIGLANFDPNDNEDLAEPVVNEDQDEDYNDRDNEQNVFSQISRFQRLKMLFSYPFFVAICVSYFMVQSVKTLYSDWSQVYLIKSLKIDSYNGKLMTFF